MSSEMPDHVAAFLEDLLDELELEEIMSIPPEQLRAELRAEGVDLELFHARMQRIIDEAGFAPASPKVKS